MARYNPERRVYRGRSYHRGTSGHGGHRVRELRDTYAARADSRDDVSGPCPECGRKGPHEDNGLSGCDRTYLCVACGHQWDAIGV